MTGGFLYFLGAAMCAQFMVSFIGGMELAFDVLQIRRTPNTLLSRIVGILFLSTAVTVVFSGVIHHVWYYPALLHADVVLHLLNFGLIVLAGLVLYRNGRPNISSVIMVLLPFLILLLLYAIFPYYQLYIKLLTIPVLSVYFIVFLFLLYRREQTLELLYTNIDEHSYRWIPIATVLFLLWSGLAFFTQLYPLPILPIIYGFYTAAMQLVITYQVFHYVDPVSFSTQEEAESILRQQDISSHQENTSYPEQNERFVAEMKRLHTELEVLLEEKKIYLNPDLTVDMVVSELGTNTKYFSIMLRQEMNTNFYLLINGYRIQRAQTILKTTNQKMMVVALECGYNSTQVFNRTFVRFVGQTPSEWRKKNLYT